MPRNQIVETTEEVKAEVQNIENDIASIEDGNGGNVKVRKPQPESVAARQLAYFAKQPKVRYRLPKSADDTKDSYEPFQVNDLMITVKKGASVNLPEDIAEGFDASQNISDNARTSVALKELPSALQK